MCIRDSFLIANSHFEFSKHIVDLIKTPQNLKDMKSFAMNYEWNKISSEFRDFISENSKL